MRLACWVLHGNFGSVYLPQVNKYKNVAFCNNLNLVRFEKKTQEIASSDFIFYFKVHGLKHSDFVRFSN